MKRQILIAFVLLCALGTSAKQRTELELLQVAKNFLLVKDTHAKRVMGQVSVTTIIKDSQLTIFDCDNGKCVIVSNDDTFKPILGYTDSPFSQTDMAPAFKWWMETINRSMEQMLTQGEMPKKATRNEKYREEVAQLLTTAWSQESPYSDLCPTYTQKTKTYHYVTGCVATAMAQIMYYYKYPEKGKGYNRWTYYPNDNKTGTTIRVNFTNTYDWNNMLPTYKKGNYNAAQANAIATLMKDCGGAVSMQYSASGSGAYASDACIALRNNFKYHDGLKLYTRSYYTLDEWMDLIYRELNDECPILYGGVTKSGAGHEFVFDGYDKDGLVHVNWGWNGTNNGYFDVTLLNSDQGTYSEGQNMVVVRLPNDERYTQTRSSLWGIEGLELTLTNNVLRANQLTAYNIDADNFTGEVQLIAEDVHTHSVTTLTQNTTFESIKNGTGYNMNLSANVSKLPNGEYLIYLASKSTLTGKEEFEWQRARCVEGTTNYYTLTIRDGNYTINKGKGNLTTAVDAPTLASQDTTSSPYTYIYNMQGQEVYKSKIQDFNLSDVPAHGVLIVKQGDTTRKVVK